MFAYHRDRIAGVDSAAHHADFCQVRRLREVCLRDQISFETAGDGKFAKISLLHLDGGSVSGEELATCKEC